MGRFCRVVRHFDTPALMLSPMATITSTPSTALASRPRTGPGVVGAVVHVGPCRRNLGDRPVGAVGRQVREAAPAPSSKPSSPSTDDLDVVWIVVEAIAIPPVQVPDIRVPEITADTGQAGWP